MTARGAGLKALSILFLTAVALALTLTTGVFAPLPLMLLRRNWGRMSFVGGSLLGIVASYFLTSPLVLGLFVAACIIAFVFSETEDKGYGYSSCVMTTLIVLVSMSALALVVAIKFLGFDPLTFTQSRLNAGLAELSLPSGVVIDKEALLKQMPSAILILMIVSIWLNSVLVAHVEVMLRWHHEHVHHIFARHDLRRWKTPDNLVWITLIAAAGTFFNFSPEWAHWVATNIFNVLVLLYFFQGLAIIVNFFVVKKVSALWRAVAYVFIFSQLFLMVACVGFIDLWIGFRNRTKPGTRAVV